ncbi:hypothetical protein [Tenacibaculum finnmarkense]|uniref:hypothetical protein n=1 Tax=Tenacibaculum finnmarkense TaxID=2781243 RepID=UPI00207A52F4|nr:hypothetical protein [Tenacibaculum finnmarkense]MCM8906784.1 hypothetical protein [Tenacibaculum finnmarkense genomovar finnmarkense]
MSWENKINNVEFSITTGDGKVFTPLWKTSGKSKEFNTAIYDFINVDGSLVTRKKSKSAKHSLTFYFQGENNIEDALEFDVSATDNRAWVVNHPFYGVLRGQPLNVAYNEDSLNVTVVTVDFWESINADYPNSEVSVKDLVSVKKDKVIAISASVFAADVVPVSADISKLKFSNEIVASSFNNVIDNDNLAEFSNAVSKSISAAENIISDSLEAIESAHAILDIPSNFEASIKEKINSYKAAFNSLKDGIISVTDRLFFESQAGVVIASLCNAVVNPLPEDYVVRTEIEEAVAEVLELYNTYISITDANQVQIYDISGTYIPNVNTQKELNNLVSFTTGNLYNFAFESKQLRTVYTNKNTNVILLTHKYMGLASEENLDNFIALNNIRLKELFVIKKGRQIKYFV